jgi:hypothetical protein
MTQQMSLMDGWMVGAGNKHDNFLHKVSALLDFPKIEELLTRLQRAAEGRPPHPPMLMFRAKQKTSCLDS